MGHQGANNKARGEAGFRSGRLTLLVMQISAIMRAKSASAISVLTPHVLKET